jgi:hypothetical protein
LLRVKSRLSLPDICTVAADAVEPATRAAANADAMSAVFISMVLVVQAQIL